MPRSSNPSSWGKLKERLARSTPAELLTILRDLHDLSPENRRFLQARFLSTGADLEHYRQQVRDAIYPATFGRRPTSIAAAKRAIMLYERATADPVGTLDLRLTFVEEGTAQALDLGVDDERYFDSLASMVTMVLDSYSRLPAETREEFLPRLERLRDVASPLGWGYGDFVRDALAYISVDDE
jgi:hypothetical protein